jgi:predicted transcriptional regulator YdeE
LGTAEIPTGKYVILTSDLGPAASVVPLLWQRIWSMTPSELGGVRSYQSDFELYDFRTANPEQAQVDIYLGLAS